MSFKRKRKQIEIKQNPATLFLIESFTHHLALNKTQSPTLFFLNWKLSRYQEAL